MDAEHELHAFCRFWRSPLRFFMGAFYAAPKIGLLSTAGASYKGGMILSGCAGFPVPKKQYFEQLTVVEVKETYRQLPTIKTLRRWKSDAPDNFGYILRAWQLITHPGDSPGYRGLPPQILSKRKDYGHFRATEAVQEAYGQMLAACEAIGARALVFETPASFSPTIENRARLSAFFEGSSRPEGLQFVWAPQGVWGTDEVARICEDLSLVQAHSGDEEGFGERSTYIRLAHAYYSEDRLEVLADYLPKDGFAIFDCNEGFRLANVLNQLIAYNQ